MNDLPQKPRLTEFAISSWLRSVHDNLRRNQISMGGDVNVSSTPSGVRIRNKKNDGIYMRWMGGYSQTSAYKEGDVVEVTVDTDQVGKDDSGNSKTYNSRKGIYLCIYPIPSQINANDFAGSMQYITDFIAQSNFRIADVVYHPIYPYPLYPPDGLPQGAIQGKYWQLIAFTPMETSVCVDGVTSTVWVHSANSGSLT